MNFSVTVNITPKTAAKLLLSGELDLASNLSLECVCNILNELMRLSTKELLGIVDNSRYGNDADVRYIPQFGKIDTIAEVPTYFEKYGNRCADCPQLGFYLKNDLSATLVANTKFGENHGKAASLLGIVDYQDNRFCPTFLTSAFCTFSKEDQQKILSKLFFRVPIIQILLRAARNNPVNGYSPMYQLSSSTRVRRGYNIKGILNFLKELADPELMSRIDNIYWEDEA